MKSSFIKYHNVEDFEKKIDVKNQVKEGKDENNDSRVAKLVKNNKVLEELLEQETLKVKASESEVSGLKEELVNVKKEKCAMEVNLKSHTNEVNRLKLKSAKDVQTIEDLKEEVKEQNKTVKIRDSACMTFKKKKEETENQLKDIVKELNLVKKEMLIEKKKESKYVYCSFCDVNFESKENLSWHVKASHCTDQISQATDPKTPSPN